MLRREFLATSAMLAYGQRHPDFRPDARMGALFADLAAPMRYPVFQGRKGKGADLSRGYTLEAAGPETAVAHFRLFMRTAMGVGDGRFAIRVRLGEVPGKWEAYRVAVTEKECVVTARDEDGVRRALIYLEEEMRVAGAPVLPLGVVERWAVVEDRITRSPLAPYRFLSGWELEDEQEYYPDAYLNKLAHCGMNGIWVAGLLGRLVASKTLPELGPAAHRLEKLRRLTERAARYGIRVYLFCIEPRALPADHPALAKYPEIRGAQGRSLCVSSPVVQGYVREVMRTLFTEVPRLAGVINIFVGERTTSCWSSEVMAKTCPRCSQRSQGEVLADDLNSFMAGIREASATAKLIAWPYGGASTTGLTSFFPYLHKDVIWMGSYDYGAVKMVHGRPVKVNEYSLSAIAPAPLFSKVAGEVIGGGRRAFAKLQMGNVHELATVPYIPVPGIVYDKMAAMRAVGVTGSMVSWITGGHASPLLWMAGEASFAPVRPLGEAMLRAAALAHGPRDAGKVVAAWEQFGRAFQLYLCSTAVFLFGPITRCPSYQLHLEKEAQLALPYNWGLSRGRVPQPYEDKVARWTGEFTPAEMIASFREIAAEWEKGLRMLREVSAVAAAAKVQFQSTANVMEFYLLRERVAAEPELVKRMREIVADDIALAEEMRRYVAADCTIGWHAEIYDYSFTETLLAEKIRHDKGTLATLARWAAGGVDRAVLESVLPTPGPVRQTAGNTYRDWLAWGD